MVMTFGFGCWNQDLISISCSARDWGATKFWYLDTFNISITLREEGGIGINDKSTLGSDYRKVHMVRQR